jgi:cell division septum initiation protein DivIVA
MMTRTVPDAENAGRVTAGGDDSSTSGPPQLVRRPNFNGDLTTLLESDPGFRGRLFGYDKLQVSNYVVWIETELLSQQRICEETLQANAGIAAQLGACQAELRRLKEQIADSANNADPAHISDRVHDILQLAAAEAADIRAAREEESDRVLAQARADASAELEQARAEAQRIREAAAAERARLDSQAARLRARADAEYAVRLSAVQRQLNDLELRRGRALEEVRQMQDELSTILQTAQQEPGGMAATG